MDQRHRPPPLGHILVVDCTRVLAGPYATMLLADLGARVIKVEPPGGGDDSRSFPPMLGGRSAYFASLNRGKESIALDLKAPADRALFDRLLARADVLVENFRPGVMERLGLGYATLSQRFPRLVVAHVSGFGQTGPQARRPAYDIIVQAMSGMMSITGHAGAPPVRVGASIGDIAAGLFATIGVLAALAERERSGLGQEVDVAMLDGQLAILESAIARLSALGEVAGPLGSRHPGIAPFQAFAASDAPFVLAAGNDSLWAELTRAIGVPELASDRRFATNALRVQHVGALDAALSAIFATRPRAEWLARLDAAGIPAGPVNRIDEALAEPQVAARNMLVETRTDAGDPLRIAGSPIKLSAHEDPQQRPPAPALDGDRAAILAWLDGA